MYSCKIAIILGDKMRLNPVSAKIYIYAGCGKGNVCQNVFNNILLCIICA